MVLSSLRTLVWLASIAAIAGGILLGAGAFSHPRPLEPIEAVALDQAVALSRHAPAYPAPTRVTRERLMPGLPALTSMVVESRRPGMWAPRAVAFGATLALAAAVFLVVVTETGTPIVGAAAAAVLLAGTAALPGTFGAAHPEPLMMLLVIVGFLAIRTMQGNAGAVIGATLLSIAWFVEPRGAWFAAAGLLAVHPDRGRMLAYVAGVAIVAGGLYVLFSDVLGTWFTYWAWESPLTDLAFQPARLLRFTGMQLLGTFGVLTLSAVLSFALPVGPMMGVSGAWMTMAIAGLVAGIAGTQTGTPGPYATFPTLVAVAVVGPIALHRVARHLSAWPGSKRLGGDPVALAALALQFVALAASAPTSLFTLGR